MVLKLSDFPQLVRAGHSIKRVKSGIRVAQDAVKKREEALTDAYRTSGAFWSQRKERSRLIPRELLRKLQGHESRLIDVDAD
jgi:hypothetical protein